jgi:beta-galactosidase
MGQSGVKLARGGIVLGGELVPLYAGAVHYWRLDRADWRACLQGVRDLGLRLVDVYVPWAVHEVAPGELEMGRGDPGRDVAAFVRLAQELDLWVILRPGPHINAELTYFGLPERVVWDPACQARSPRGNPVMLPVLPKMFPVPSYASGAYHDEVRQFFRGIGETLAPLCYPDGPIVMVQVDNEGALYFRDGAFDQDYHPDAIVHYRDFLRTKYGTITALQEAYGEHAAAALPVADGEHDALRFANAQPPRRLDAANVDQLAWYLDWAEFQEVALTTALGRFSEALAEAGFGLLPRSHNFPMAHESTPLNAGKLESVIDLIGFDYYHSASELTRDSVARRTSELAARGEVLDVPAFAAELGAGFPPYFPPLSEQDSIFTTLTALAYGLRGFNVYMAVDRDRWIGAPLDRRGRARPFAQFWRTLCGALDASSFHELHRQAPVRLMVPRIERRLARLLHAFGPASGALMSVMGQGARESCVEDDLDLGYLLAVEADNFARAFAAALDDRGIPFAYVGGEDRGRAMQGAAWVICATSGGMSPGLAASLSEAGRQGVRVTVGPRRPTRDGGLRLTEQTLLGDATVELVGQSDPASVDAVVSRAVEALGLTSYAAQPDAVHATVHQDDAGEIRVVFVINPTEEDRVARVTLGCDASWDDPFDGSRTSSQDGLLELRVRPRAVRMLMRS